MTTEVTKYSVYDPRIVQTKPKYAVEKGALSLTNVSFNAQTASTSTVQFNVLVPSENVFIDRAVDLIATQTASITVSLTPGTGGTIPAGTSLQGLLAPAAFPVQQSVTQASSTINDATVTVNTQDVLPQVLRLCDLRDARRMRTCPTMLDRYLTYPDSRVVNNSPLRSWDQTTNSDEVPNGGFSGFKYCDAAWNPAQGTVAVPVVPAGQTYYQIINGIPVLSQAIGTTVSLTFYVLWTSVEKLLLPPFIFADQDELSTGLFGVQNFQVQLNLAPTPIRSLRMSSQTTFPAGVNGSGVAVYGHASYTSSAWGSPANGQYGMFSGQPQLGVQFLTPSLDIPLPPKSIVPYMEFPRYLTTGLTVPAGYSGAGALQSNTITLPNIPDLLVIYVKPTTYADPTQGDWTLPIRNISINFDNFSGLLANHTQQQLYKMSVDNSVDMDFSQWSGLGPVESSWSGVQGTGVLQGGLTPLVGGPLVLRPGRDFALQAGQAPGLVGNFQLQFNLGVTNYTGASLTGLTIFVVTVNSGFFETIKGSSRIIKGVLTEQDILSAPAHAPEDDLERKVGAAKHEFALSTAQKLMGKSPSHARARSAMAYM